MDGQTPTWTRCGGGRRRRWVFFWQAQRIISSRKPSPRKPVPAPMMAYLLTTEPAGNPLLSDPTTTTAAGVRWQRRDSGEGDSTGSAHLAVMLSGGRRGVSTSTDQHHRGAARPELGTRPSPP